MSTISNSNRISILADKIKEGIICPAKKEAESIVRNANDISKGILDGAAKKAESMLKEADDVRQAVEKDMKAAAIDTLKEYSMLIKSNLIKECSLSEISSVMNSEIVSDKRLAQHITESFCAALNGRFPESINVSIGSPDKELADILADWILKLLKTKDIDVNIEDAFNIVLRNGKISSSIDSQFIVESVVSKMRHDIIAKVFDPSSRTFNI